MKDLEALIASERCIYIPRTRRKGKIYIYASRRVQGKMKEVYIAPETKVAELTKEQVLRKLSTLQVK